jgi:kynurenine formamidase
VTASPWGPDDEIGRLNWMTPESQSAALAQADGARPFDLAVDSFIGMPSWTVLGDPKYDIWLTHTPQDEGHAYAGTAITMYSHTGTHVCGLNHLGEGGRFWNDWTAETHLGSRAWDVGGVYPPIIARGVLLDVAGDKGVDCLEDSYPITPDDLTSAGAGELRPADVALVRTGRMSRWPDTDGFMSAPPGLGMEAARFLAEEAEVMCVGVDCGGEALPPEEADGFLPVHSYLMARVGIPVFENLWLEDLAVAGVREFAFLAFPLKLAGSTGAPVRPVALPIR